MLEGLDVSAHNLPPLVPWREVGFGFVRISHGMGSDLSALEHLSRARDTDLACLGVYHWLKANSPGAIQAEHFHSRAKALETGYDRFALALDLEDPDKKSGPPWDRVQYAKTAVDFLARLRELDDRPCAIYGSPGYLATLFLPRELVGPLWAAHWGAPSPLVISPWSDWTIHQYSNSGGTLDRNRFRGTCEQFRAIFTPPRPVVNWDPLSANLRAVARAAGHRLGSVTDFVSVREGPNIEPEGGSDGE